MKEYEQSGEKNGIHVMFIKFLLLPYLLLVIGRREFVEMVHFFVFSCLALKKI